MAAEEEKKQIQQAIGMIAASGASGADNDQLKKIVELLQNQ